MKRGEIWWADLPIPRGSEPGYRRPVLIVQADAFNRSAIRTIVCASITTNLTLAGAPGNVQLEVAVSGLPRTCVVNVSQLMSVDRVFLMKRVRLLDAETMRKVDAGLGLLLDIP